jgi:hypothetical protein
MRKQVVGDGEAPAGELGVPVGLDVGGALDGDPLVGPPLGEPDVPPLGDELAGAPVLGRAEGLLDGFFPPGVPVGLVAAGVAAVLGPAAPPTEPDGSAAPDALCDGTWPDAGAPVVAGPAGAWFAAGAPVNAPETSSATRPALARTAAPTATAAPARRRWFPGGCPGCPGPAGPVGTDMRGGTFHSSEA